uniref:LRRNT domain-containing protein n=1 Tax=Sinocyclocheilus rhinocerous TaxID=307959 RepID=A0A673JDE0_9TELE
MLCVAVLPMAFLVVGSSKLCPRQCFCYDASELVDCRSRGFVHIPHSIPHGTWLLELSGNKLSELRSTSFTGIWALRLDLTYNELRVLPPDFSQGLTALKDLKLSHNALERLESHSLEDLESLERLDLSHNHVQVIEVGAFRGLAILRHLNLAWNQLTVVQGGLLTMTHLQMSENPWTCDCELHRVFSKILHVRHLHVDDYVNITCHSPLLLAGASLGLMHSQLCIAETATVLVLTGTVMVTVVAALVMAELKPDCNYSDMRIAK